MTESTFSQSQNSSNRDRERGRERESEKEQTKESLAKKYLKDLISNSSWLTRCDVMSSHARKIHQYRK